MHSPLSDEIHSEQISKSKFIGRPITAYSLISESQIIRGSKLLHNKLSVKSFYLTRCKRKGF